MRNIQDLSTIVDTINYKTLPSIFELFSNLSFHIGEYKWSAKTDDFGGWLKCDGRSLSRTEYSDLFDVIGTTFGSDDVDTFKLPDMRGRVMGCIGSGPGLSARNLGSVVGEETHVLSSTEMPSHSHTGTTNAGGGHSHTASSSTTGSHNHGGSTANGGTHSHTINDPGHTHTQTTINDDFNNSGENPPGFTADSAGTRTWSNINSATTGITINNAGDHNHTISSDGSHSHSITVDAVSNHTHAFTTDTTGGGNAHNNMQPTAFIGQVFIYAGWNPSVILVN